MIFLTEHNQYLNIKKNLDAYKFIILLFNLDSWTYFGALLFQRLNRARATERVAGDKIHAKSAWDVEAGMRCRKLVLVQGATEEDASTQTEERAPCSWPPLSWKDSKGEERVLWREIDRVSRLVFPFFFFLFVLAYWRILLLKKGRGGLSV